MHFPSGEWKCYANWEMRRDGKPERPGNFTEILDETKPVFLRHREGKVFTGSYSPDGKTWKGLPPYEIEFGAKLRVGVGALQNTPAGYEAILENFRAHAGKKATEFLFSPKGLSQWHTLCLTRSHTHAHVLTP